MALNNIRIQPQQPAGKHDLSPKICIIGCGGGGVNSVNNMVTENIEGVELFACNSDSQSLQNSVCPHKIQLGPDITGGLGAGAKPEVGRAAAEESLEEVMSYISDANMVFITAGMGGGTGTGAAPVIAKACREQGILTVGVVTKPFHFEGSHRMKLAEAGIEEMQQYVDTLIVIPNQNLFRVANEKTTFADAFKMADSVLQSGVLGVTNLMVMPGLINLDFADIRAAMQDQGKAMLGTGEASGDRRAIEAAEAAINNPLLDDVSMKGARGVIINITGGYDMTLFEADEACNRIRDEVDPEANIIFGSTFDESLDGKMRVSVIATGIDQESRVRYSDNTQTTNNTTAYKKPVTPSRATVSKPAPTLTTSQSRTMSARTERAVIEEQPEAELFEQTRLDNTYTRETNDTSAQNMRGTRLNDSFIPPAPVEIDRNQQDRSNGSTAMAYHPTPVPVMKAQVATAPIPSVQNMMPETPQAGYNLRPPVPGAQIPEQHKPKKSSFLERLTGLGGHSSNRQDDFEAPSHPAATAAPTQGSLAIDSPSTKPQTSEDDLDIPAFLRRQAN